MKIAKPAVQVFTAFIWFAILGGLLEAAFLLIKWAAFHRFTWTTLHVLWMAPVANIAILAGPGVLLAALAIWQPTWVTLSRVTGFLTFGLVACLLMIGFNGGLAPWSVIVLALGVAIRVAQVAGRRAESFERLLQRTAPRLTALVVAIGILLPGWMAVRERMKVHALPEVSGKPNVLLIILDTVRAASLSLYGHVRPTTPRLDALAETSTVFELAIAPAPWTLPSHASMFTGRWPHELRAGWQTPLSGEFPTIAEVLQRNGYVTAGFTANHYYTTRQSGLARGFIHYEDLAINPQEILRASLLGQAVTGLYLHGRYAYQPERSTHRKRASEIRTGFLEWVAANEHQPWFAFLNLFDAHKPYRVPASFIQRLEGADSLADGYEETIRYLDFELGKLLDALEERGELNNTLIIVTSDHGEQFGRHNIFGHGNSLYRRVVRVPLLIRLPPKVAGGARVSRPVSLRDLPRTILDLVSIRDSTLPGVSLAEAWNGSGIYPDTVLTELLEGLGDVSMALVPPMYALVTREYEYIRQSNGQVEIFKFSSDPLEQVNLADSTSTRRVAEQFGNKLDRLLSGGSQR